MRVSDAPPTITRLEDITAESLTTALQACGALSADVAVRGFTAERSGAGQMSGISRLAIEYAGPVGDAPATVMAKYASEEVQARTFGRDAGFYLRETRFYAELAEALAVRAPAVYFVATVDESGEFLILFEDLMPARVLDQIEGCGIAEAELAVSQIARLHGSSWDSQTLASREWLLGGSALWKMAAAEFEPLMALFCKRYHDALADELVDFGKRLVREVSAWAALLDTRRCLWHGDFRLDNLAFDARAGEVPLAVFDWQTVTLGPPVADLAYFLGGTLEPEDRRQNEERLVQRYYGELIGQDVTNYAFEECWRDYRAHAVGGFVAAVLGAAKAERTERGDRLLLTMARRHGRHALDLDALGALR